MSKYVCYTAGFESTLQVWVYDDEQKKLRCEKEILRARGTCLILNQAGTRLYVGSEVPDGEGEIAVYDTSAPLAPRLMKIIPVGDHGPGYLSLAAEEDYLFTASFFSGSIQAYHLDGDGCPVQRSYQEAFTTYGSAFPKGSFGQAAPRSHCILPMPGTSLVLATDYSGDRLLCYRLQKDGSLLLLSELCLQPGEAPRHLVFSPDREGILYLNTEYSGMIYTIEIDRENGLMKCLNRTGGLEGEAAYLCANLRIEENGKYLYNTNRSNENISVFRLEGEKGLPVYAGAIPDVGYIRDFIFDPKHQVMLAGNQSMKQIQLFEMNWKNGLCWPLEGTVKAKTPAAFVFQKTPVQK